MCLLLAIVECWLDRLLSLTGAALSFLVQFGTKTAPTIGFGAYMWISASNHSPIADGAIYDTPDNYNTGYTEHSAASKIPSKRVLGQKSFTNPANQGIWIRNYFFRVSSKKMFPLQNRGFQTRVNTPVTPEFWTVEGCYMLLWRECDTASVPCALTGQNAYHSSSTIEGF